MTVAIRPASRAIERVALMINLAVFKRIAAAVLVSGVLAGALLTAVQQVQVSKIILQAEVYEEAAQAATAAAGHDHSTETSAIRSHEHDHEADAWEPANGVERTGYTVLANISMAIGFALFLAAAICVSGRQVGWRSGLLWGAAGYLVFFVAPSLGLPPEVPGTQAAPLHDRQLWWLLAAGSTALGLGIFVYARHRLLKLLGLVLLLVPHLVGAPQPEVHASAAPESLALAFIQATAIANAVFWLALGGLTGFFYKKFA
ncbi:CbtA family protein [Herbaspirillum autotrophicum]|uniref:CbtA family protein n=1 Tax=Herbaspirillum autotrophicum TaxID=180195 RepID=UPI0038CC1060